MVWGTVIAFAIIAEAISISSNSHSVGNKIAIMLTFPIWGAIGGFILGGGAWILISILSTVVMVLWVIVVIIIDLVAILALSDA